MKRDIKLPSGILGSFGKDFHCKVELDMRAKHFDLLSTVSPDTEVESVVLSILNDLVDDIDVWNLTKPDMEYLFTLVKCVSMGDSLTLKARCPNMIKVATGSGVPARVCSEINEFKVRVTESDVVCCDLDTAPEISFDLNGNTEVFKYRLPSMREEIDLLTEFMERGYSRKDIVSATNKEIMMEYAKRRMLLHLHHEKFTPYSLVEALKESSFRTMVELTRQVDSMARYGLVHKTYKTTCPNCGGTVEARLPLLGGLSV